MKGHTPLTKESLVLLCEDSSYALKQISSIIKDDDYSDLGNHATEAMGETGLFSLTQVCIPVAFICSVIFLSLFHADLIFLFHENLIFLFHAGGGHVEKANGPLRIS